MMVQYNYKKKRARRKKNVEKKLFETKTLIKKIYNTFNQCETIFALLALDSYREKAKE